MTTAIEIYLEPLKSEIDSLKTKLKMYQKHPFETENDLESLTDIHDCINSENLERVALKIDSTRSSSRRNYVNENRGFFPISSKKLGKRVRDFKSGFCRLMSYLCSQCSVPKES